MKLSDTDLTLPDRQMVENNLMQQEELLWVGKPIPRLFSAGSLATFLFSLPLLGFVIFWTWGAAQGSAIFACFSIPFWCVGIGLFCSPWWTQRTQKRTVLVITNRRAMEDLPRPVRGGEEPRMAAGAGHGEIMHRAQGWQRRPDSRP